jgi:hypothetical protein
MACSIFVTVPWIILIAMMSELVVVINVQWNNDVCCDLDRGAKSFLESNKPIFALKPTYQRAEG